MGNVGASRVRAAWARWDDPPRLWKWREAWLGRVFDAVHLAVIAEPVMLRRIGGRLNDPGHPVEPAPLSAADGTGRVRRRLHLPRRYGRRRWREIAEPQQHGLAVRIGQRLAVGPEHTHPGV